MKKQLLKRLLAFIVMMFSISFLNAQCPGNKVQLFFTGRSGGCISKCVPQNKVQEYFNQGWSYSCTGVYLFKSNIKGQRTKSPVFLTSKMRVSRNEQGDGKKQIEAIK